MVTTTVDLTAISSENKVTLIYPTNDVEHAFVGLLSFEKHVDFCYDSGAFLKVCNDCIPQVVKAAALAYLLINDENDAFRVQITPSLRNEIATSYDATTGKLVVINSEIAWS